MLNSLKSNECLQLAHRQGRKPQQPSVVLSLRQLCYSGRHLQPEQWFDIPLVATRASGQVDRGYYKKYCEGLKPGQKLGHV